MIDWIQEASVLKKTRDTPCIKFSITVVVPEDRLSELDDNFGDQVQEVGSCEVIKVSRITKDHPEYLKTP